MNRYLIYLISFAALLLTVPWFFAGPGGEPVFGFPMWAFYSFVMTVLYAVLISAFIHLFWERLAGDEDEEGQE